MRVGIFGGGQLAQMTSQAAVQLGLEIVIFEQSADSPAGRLTQREVVGRWADPQALQTFASQCDVITLENEFVEAEILARLEAEGHTVFPRSATLALIQDKVIQKQRLAAAGLAVAGFQAVANIAQAESLASEWGWPLLLKARRNGYDGYGNATLREAQDLEPAWERLSKGGRSLFFEQFIPFERELAVMVVRGRAGELATYPVVETIQREHICHVVRAPAELAPAVAHAATQLAVAAIEAIDGVGVFGVELFLLPGDLLLLNEIAPRPHNSGHYTIEACETSQFENHLRAILGWPLGPTELLAPAAVMVNVLGSFAGPLPPAPASEALAIPGAHVHLYGKREVRRGRKMGHVTALGASLAEAEKIARRAAELVKL